MQLCLLLSDLAANVSQKSWPSFNLILSSGFVFVGLANGRIIPTVLKVLLDYLHTASNPSNMFHLSFDSFSPVLFSSNLLYCYFTDHMGIWFPICSLRVLHTTDFDFRKFTVLMFGFMPEPCLLLFVLFGPLTCVSPSMQWRHFICMYHDTGTTHENGNKLTKYFGRQLSLSHQQCLIWDNATLTSPRRLVNIQRTPHRTTHECTDQVFTEIKNIFHFTTVAMLCSCQWVDNTA